MEIQRNTNCLYTSKHRLNINNQSLNQKKRKFGTKDDFTNRENKTSLDRT